MHTESYKAYNYSYLYMYFQELLNKIEGTGLQYNYKQADTDI